LCQTIPFRSRFGFQPTEAGLCGNEVRSGSLHLLVRCGGLVVNLSQFLAERIVKGLPALLPLGLPGRGELFLLNSCGYHCLSSTSHCHHSGAPVEHQQEQDQRAHGAEQDRKKGKGRHLQALPAASHAAAPGRVPCRPALPVGEPAVRAVSKWMAAVRLCTASSKAPAPASALRFCCSTS